MSVVEILHSWLAANASYLCIVVYFTFHWLLLRSIVILSRRIATSTTPTTCLAFTRMLKRISPRHYHSIVLSSLESR